MGWIGQPLPRREDLPLLTGRGSFVDDVLTQPFAAGIVTRCGARGCA
jgi:hypothetical protein